MATDITQVILAKAASGDPLVLGKDTYTYSLPVLVKTDGFKLIGAGFNRTNLTYVGPKGATAKEQRGLRLARNSPNFELADFTFFGPGQTSGMAALGIGDYQGPGETISGTTSYSGVVRKVQFRGWDKAGVCGTSSTAAASELVIDACEYGECNSGWDLIGGNTLNFEFRSPKFSSLNYGVLVSGASNVHFTGVGSSSTMLGPILRVTGAFIGSMKNIRAENSGSTTGVFLEVLNNPTFCVDVTLELCSTEGGADATKYAAVTTGNTTVRLLQNKLMATGGVKYTGVVGADKGVVMAHANDVYGPLLTNVDGSHPANSTNKILGNYTVDATGAITGAIADA